jgi:hypothetical protein
MMLLMMIVTVMVVMVMMIIAAVMPILLGSFLVGGANTALGPTRNLRGTIGAVLLVVILIGPTIWLRVGPLL